jgi:hypothetical protein
MAVQASVKDAFTFVGGLNTEGGYFLTPENSYKEGTNVTPKLDGSIERRTGLDYESGYTLYASAIDASQKDLWAFTTGVWTTVAGNGNLDFIVVQTGPILHFYNNATSVVSASKLSFTVDLSNYKAAGNLEIEGTAVCSFASTYGKLIVTSQNTKPIAITYDVSTATISVEAINLQVRDFKGKPLINNSGNLIPIDVEYTQAEWTALGVNILDVVYNLENQGWTTTQIDAYKTANADKYPANTKSWIYGKDSNDVFSPSFLNKQDFGNSPAPKGRFILDAFANVTYAPKGCSFFAGRVWYAGMPSSELLGTVYFSQVLTDISKAGNCYQTNDPTSEVLSDLEDDDGGTIEIPEAGEIVFLQPLGRGLMVLATNGVWFISGIDQGFKATNYAVERVSTVGCSASKSVVVVEDTMLYWSTGGVYVLQPTNAIEYTAKNASDQAIKSFYQSIPTLGKLYAEGSYNSSDKLIYWLYSDVFTSNTSDGRYNKNSILALDLQLNAWYWYQLDTTTGVIPVSIETTKETTTVSEEYNVISGTNEVIAGTDDVIASIPTTSGTRKDFKVLSLHPVTNNNYSITFADFSNVRENTTRFKDWYTFNNVGVEKEAYFITGYNMGGNGPARTKTGQYLNVFMKRTETAFDVNANPLNQSSCKMQVRWDFTDNSFPGKWAPEVQVYRQLRPFFVNPGAPFDDGYPLVITKNKLLGRGKAAQFKFRSEPGMDMKIVGWTGTFVGATNV